MIFGYRHEFVWHSKVLGIESELFKKGLCSIGAYEPRLEEYQ